MMDCAVSSAFSSDPVNQLNRLAGELDCRLFAFAYYAPKRYDSVDGIGAREAFWMAVTNLYALYHDCSPFRKKLETVFDKNYKPPINLTISFHDLLSGLRGMYCHNCSGDDNPFVISEVIASFKKSIQILIFCRMTTIFVKQIFCLTNHSGRKHSAFFAKRPMRLSESIKSV